MREEALFALAAVLLLGWYLVLVTGGGVLGAFPRQAHGQVFNSMLEHLLVGRFDVDPAAVGVEGFAREGRVYAYWGIFCALIRAPLLLVPGAIGRDVTLLSLVGAAWLAGAAKLRLALGLRRALPASPVTDAAIGLFALYATLGGATVGQLKVSIFQEVVFWAFAQASLFVMVACGGLLRGEFGWRRLAVLAGLAGLALITRVSTGIGLYAALGLLLGVLAVREWRRGAVCRGWFVAVVILLGFIAVAGGVNYGRWGSVATFADYDRYLYNEVAPDRLLRMRAHGLFNLLRLPYGFQYYFLPFWAIPGADGASSLEAFRATYIDVAEYPPSSPFITDALPFILAILAVPAWRQDGGRLLALAAGLAVPWLLMMTAIYMAYRYRVEFYPLLDLLAAAGVMAIGRDARTRAVFARHLLWIAPVTVGGVTLAHAMMVIYHASPFASPEQLMRFGPVDYYGLMLARRFGL